MEVHGETAYELLSSDALKQTPVNMSSSGNKEKAESGDKKKKSRPRLSIKLFSGGNKKKDGVKKVNECHSPEGTYKTVDHLKGVAVKADPVLEKSDDEDELAGKEPLEDDVPEEKSSKVVYPDELALNRSKNDSKPISMSPALKEGRRRSLSACADVQDTKIKLKGTDKKDRGKEKKKLIFKEEEDTQKDDDKADGDDKEEGDNDEEEEEESEEDQLSPLPSSPTKSCLRGRSATFGYAGEVVETASRPRSVSFAPDTVDPPPRNQKYRAWIESRTRPPVNIQHEKHKQKMNQLKKVNMADYLPSRKPAGTSGMMSSNTSAFGGSGMMM